MKDETANDHTTGIGRADSVAVTAILVVGAGLGGFIAGMGLVRAVFRLFDPSKYPIELLADIPVELGGSVLGAHGSSLVVTVSSLPTLPLWLLSISEMIGALAIGLVTVCFAFVLARVAQRKPFHRSMRSAALVAGCAIAFGSLLSQGLGGLARMMVAFEVREPAEPAFLFEPLPILVGFAVLALAYVFQAGNRLQKDTEGLV